MDKTKKRGMISHVPMLTPLILIGAITVSTTPIIAFTLIYDRAAIIGGGFWRVLTAHLVHFNGIHLLYNLLAFGVAGCIIECKGYKYFMLLCFLTTCLISVALFIFKPDIVYYGGLSGLACGAMYYCALSGLGKDNQWRAIYILVIVFIPVKILAELYENSSLLPYWGQHTFVTVPLSHIVGTAVAIIVYFFSRSNDKQQNDLSGRHDVQLVSCNFMAIHESQRRTQ